MLREVKEKLNKLFNKTKSAPSDIREDAGFSVSEAATPTDQKEKIYAAASTDASISLSQTQTSKRRVLKIKEDAQKPPVSDLEKHIAQRFDSASCNLKAMDSLIIRDAANQPKKPWWKVIITDIFNGLITVILILTAVGLLAESYFNPPHAYMAWLAMIPFAIAALNTRSLFISFLFGQTVGTFFYMFILYWIFPTVQEGTNNAALGMLAVSSLSMLLGLQFALFSSICFFIKKSKFFFPVAAACSWVMLELAHQLLAYNFLGFPWFILGYTQFENLPLIQISSITGAYGVSFLIVFFGFSLAMACGKSNLLAKTGHILLPLILIAAAYIYGNTAIQQRKDFESENPQKLSVALMQPNTHNRMLKGEYEDITYIIADQSEKLKEAPLDLIIWPESSLPGTFAEDDYYTFIKTLSEETSAMQITGSYYQKDRKEYVSAALFDATGIKDIYSKVKLVPFGEFLPFKSILGNFYKRNNIETFTGTFSTGESPSKVLKMDIEPKDNLMTEPAHKTFNIGANICFESLFPEIWRAQANAGAQFFVNMTNDGWFLETAAPYQHLRVNVFRAVETRLPVLRAANTGVSAWITTVGEIKFKTQTHVQETALFKFSFQPRTSKSFYTKNGDIFAYCCTLIALTTLVVSIVFLGLGVRRVRI